MNAGIRQRLLALVAVSVSLFLVNLRETPAPRPYRPRKGPLSTPASGPRSTPSTPSAATPTAKRAPAPLTLASLPRAVARLQSLSAKDNPVTALQVLQDALDLLGSAVDLTRPNAGELLHGKVLVLKALEPLLRQDADAERQLAGDLADVVVMRLEELVRLPVLLPRMKGFVVATLIARGNALTEGSRQFVAEQLAYAPRIDVPSLRRAIERLAATELEHSGVLQASLALVTEQAIMGTPATDYAIRQAAYRYLAARGRRPGIPLEALRRHVEEARQRRDQTR